MALTANFELGTNGAEIQTSDAGDASAWDSINRNASITYDTTHALGTQSAHFLTDAGSGAAHLLWTTSFGTQTEYYGRVCLYCDARQPTEIALVRHNRTGGSGLSWQLSLLADGKLKIYDQGAGVIATSTASVPLDQWCRVEWHINNTTGLVEVLFYNDATSTSLTETVVSSTGNSIGADTDGVDFGPQALSTSYWMDGIVDVALAYPGPYTEPSQLLAPSADSVDGAWTDQAGGTSLAAAIDETTASDTDYIRSELSPSNSGCRVKLGAGTDPASSTGHVIHWRPGKSATGGETIDMTVKLRQGGGNSLGAGTLIATFTRNNVDAFTSYAETLSGGEADSITDYTDLYLEFFATVA